MTVLVRPAYGRDFRTAEEAVQYFEEGFDFIYLNPASRWNNKPCSIRDFPGELVEIRYLKLTALTMYQVPGEKRKDE